MKTLLRKINGDSFVTYDGTDYFIEGVKYTDNIDLLLDAIAHVKESDYNSLFTTSNTKEDYWKKHFNYQYSNGSLVLWSNPTELWESELARRGTLLCTKCNTPKYMHYHPICPKCDKPVITPFNVIDMIPLCNYLENLHNLKKRELWDWIKNNVEFSNDSFISLHRYFEGDSNKYIKMINDYSPIQTTLYFISW